MAKSPAKTTLYTSNQCRYCKQIKAFLQKNKIPFMELNVEKNRRAAMDFTREGFRSVPVLKMKGKVFQGFDAKKLQRFIDENR